jgi:hypothetical protein
MARGNFVRILIYTFVSMLILATAGFLAALKTVSPPDLPEYPLPRKTTWEIQSVDTMKYSRDLAREKLHDPSFDRVIDAQVARIAEAGANYVAVDTPYDEEFVPFLKRWVAAARRHRLRVWFRGNFSGWEGWFGYPRISSEEHHDRTVAFIRTHPELFESGDIFSSCPECENGGPGDPRQTGNVDGFREFLVTEHQATQLAFRGIGKHVASHYFSMNADVARLVMDRDVTRALGGVVTVDHYVKDPAQLVADIRALADRSGGRVMLGEMGAPIPDIHGDMSEREQAQWLQAALGGLSGADRDRIAGVNYWVNAGSSTALWNVDNRSRSAVSVLKKYFRPNVLHGFVFDELGRPVEGAQIRTAESKTSTDRNGHFELRVYGDPPERLPVSAAGFREGRIETGRDGRPLATMLIKERQDLSWRALRMVRRMVDRGKEG